LKKSAKEVDLRKSSKEVDLRKSSKNWISAIFKDTPSSTEAGMLPDRSSEDRLPCRT